MKRGKTRRPKAGKRGGRKTRGLCERADKPKYTKTQALGVALDRSRKHGTGFRSYRCEFCGWWHLTTQTKRKD